MRSAGQAARRAVWPVRAVEDAVPPRSHRRGAIEPFFGAALEQWAHRCAAAPNGLVYNRVTKRQMTEMRSSTRGEKVEVAVVGSVELSPDLPALSLNRWLRTQATEADLVPETDVRLVRLVFEDGVAGALIETQGRRARGARQGEPHHRRRRFSMAHTHPLVSATESVTANISLVSKAASRFGELEIVTGTGDDNRLLFVDAPEAELQLASGL